ncbi:MAG: type I polyketide synthase [Verrucomicrobia bacterium]|nr:type I polyketide synthase [Verrucomicrobiota bacterium]
MTSRKAKGGSPNAAHHEPIAVIGIGCRFPGGVTGPDSYWKLLLAGTDAITDVPADRWNHDLIYHPEPGKPGKTVARQAGFVTNVQRFDADFFGISPREACQMDPQHRLVLEVAWEALEDAGVAADRIGGTATGVFVGISTHEYQALQSLDTTGTYTSTGQAACMAANRVSYAFNLIGPSFVVDTACSSALVAAHLACQSIWSGESAMALTGGVNLFVDPYTFVGFSYLSMLSPDSRCMAFDARANGFVRSEGAGMVLLKPLARALADGDRIYAVILGTAANQDGHSQGLTFPSQASQEKLLRDAYGRAGVDAARVRYMEAHGTGTQVGDPIEAGAIGSVLGRGRPAGRELLLGSAKTNIGHLESGSGAAGLIKACLVVKNRLAPRNLHFEQPNPQIPFAELGLRVPVANEPLDGEAPLVAGVNSFGFGGTNAHIVVAEPPPAPAPPSAAPGRPPFLLPLSAKSPEALKAVAASYGALLTVPPAGEAPPLADICHTASVRRTHHAYRLAVTANSSDELRQRLEAYAAGQGLAGVVAGRVVSGQRRRIAFVFTGQGSQWWAMARELLEREPVFRAVVERADRQLQKLGHWSLLRELAADEKSSRMNVTAIAQPAIFAIEAGLVELWRSWGVEPDAVVGHSIGEIAAAHAAGVMDFEDAVRVVFHRSRLMERPSARGGMLAVGLPHAETLPYLKGLEDRIAVAAINSPTSLTLSGDPKALETIALAMRRDRVGSKSLDVSYAFHSPQLESIRDELLESLRGLAPRQSTVRLFSTVTGGPSTGADWDAEYWWKNLRQTVRFAEAVDALIREDYGVFLEIGPQPMLAGSVKDCLRHRDTNASILASLRRGRSDAESLATALGTLYTLGAPVRWQAVHPAGRLVSLPSYPWQREFCWSEAEELRRQLTVPLVSPLLGNGEIAPQPTWATHLDTRLLTWLLHHRLQGAPVLPAAGYVEMALAAGCAAKAAETVTLEEVAFESPCFVVENERLPIEFRFQPDEARFAFFSRSRRDGNWSRHANGRILPLTGPPPATQETPETIASRLPETLSSEAIYELFTAVGLDYGPSFRGIRGTHRADGEALGEVVLPEALEPEREKYRIHPALLDACFQVILATLPPAVRVSRLQRAFIPVSLDRIRLYRRPPARVFSHVRLVEASEDALAADIRILDEQGGLLLDLSGLRCRAIEGASAKGSPLDDLLFVSEWQSQPRPEAPAAAATPAAAKTWLILAGNNPLGATLSDRLRARGEQVVLARPGDAFAAREDREFIVNPAEPQDMKKLVASVLEQGLPPLAGVLYLWALDGGSPETTADAGLGTTTSLLHLVQAFAEQADLAPPRLWIVTSRAQAAKDDERADIAVAQAPLWGLRRVTAFEHARLRPAVVDLGSPDSEEEINSLLAEMDANLPEDEILLRGNDRFVHRYTRTTLERCAPLRVRNVAPAAQPFRARTARLGVLDNLKLFACPPPAPGPGEVAIEVKAAGLNFADVLKALGLYPGVTVSTVALGAECAGVVRALGEGSEELLRSTGAPPLRVGDAVVAVAPHCFGSFVTTPAVYALPMPAGLGFEQAAAIPIVFLTVQYGLVHLARLRKGERILIHAATGGVGLSAIQIAKRVGAEIFATAGSDAKREFLRSLGIQHIMDSRSVAFADEVMAATGGEGVDVVLNSLAGEAIPKGLSILRPFGRFIEIGKRDVYANARLGMRPLRNNIALHVLDLDQAIRTRPELVAELFREVAAGFADGAFNALPVRAFPITELVEAFRHLSKAQHIGKVVISNDVPEVPVTFPHEKPPVREDATYLVTGGLGGFGRAIAGWVADRGARHVVLVSRSGPASPAAQETVTALAAKGCTAHVWAADVGDAAQVRQVVARVASELPPLRGIVHAAMVLDDGIMMRLDAQRFATVMKPKAAGAWNLHCETRELPLDFFVMTSSIASIYGSPGQANYAAANTFLDALAHHRRGLGLPALTLNLGALDAVGHVALRPELATYLTNMGIPPMPPQEVLEALDLLLGSDAPQVGLARLDFKRLANGPLQDIAPPRLAELLAAARTAGGGRRRHDRQLLAALEKVAPAEREKLLLAAMVQEMSRVLGVAPDRFDTDRPLSELGLDSLMTVELINWMEDALDFRVPTVELMKNPTTTELARLLVALYAKRTTEGQPPTEQSAAAAPPKPDAGSAVPAAQTSDQSVTSPASASAR